MKKLFSSLAAFLAAQTALFAQTLTVNSGYSAQFLFQDTAGFSISALGTDGSGNIFYIESGKFDGSTPDTRLFERTAASSYAAPVSALFSYGSSVIGSYVKVNAGTAYFGENTNYSIRSISVAGGSATTLANVPFNYDFAFRGSQAFIDKADSSFSNNTISAGALTPVVNTGGASGPIVFTSTGDLIYGGSASSEPGNIYQFTKKQIDDVLSGTTGHTLTLSDATVRYTNDGNQYLSLSGNTNLYQTGYISTNTTFVGKLDYYNLSTPASALAAQGSNNGDIFSGAAPLNSGVAVAVSSNFGSGPSAVYVVNQVPEPSSLLLCAGGGLWILGWRARRRSVKTCHAL